PRLLIEWPGGGRACTGREPKGDRAVVDTRRVLTPGFGQRLHRNKEARMYRINPFQPITRIVDELRNHEEGWAASALSRSAMFSVHEEQPEAMLRLAMAYCAWRGVRLDDELRAEIVEFLGRGQVASISGR